MSNIHVLEPDVGDKVDTTGIYDDPQLTLPGVDGYEVNRIGLKIAGGPDLDRSNIDDVAGFRDLKLGQRFRCVVEGYVTKLDNQASITEQGQVDVVHGTKTLRADTVRDIEIL